MPYKRRKKYESLFNEETKWFSFIFASFFQEQLAQHYYFPLIRWCTKSRELCARLHRTMNAPPSLLNQLWFMCGEIRSCATNNDDLIENSPYANDEDVKRKIYIKNTKVNRKIKTIITNIRKHINTTAFSNWNNCLFVVQVTFFSVSLACNFFYCMLLFDCGVNNNP